jgi:hypothetical protein
MCFSKYHPSIKTLPGLFRKHLSFYFYDTGQVIGDQGIKLENAVACAIQKELHFREDCLGEEGKLYYVKNKDGKEIDFCISKEDRPSLLLEVKWNDNNLSPNFEIFKKFFLKSKWCKFQKNWTEKKLFQTEQK